MTKNLKNSNQNKSTEKYDFIFSLGSACSCAMNLKVAGLRSCSGPFDWVAGVDFAKRIKLLIDKAPLFTDSDTWTFLEKRHEPEPRNVYRNNRTQMSFPHDFPLNVDIKISYPEIKEKYKRRLERLYQHLESNEKVLGVYLDTQSQPISAEKIKNQIQKLRKKYQADFHLLYIQHTPNISERDIQKKQITSFITLIQANFYNDPAHLENDVVQKILSHLQSTSSEQNKKWLKRQALKKKIKRWFFNKRHKNGVYYWRILGFKYIPKTPKD